MTKKQVYIAVAVLGILVAVMLVIILAFTPDTTVGDVAEDTVSLREDSLKRVTVTFAGDFMQHMPQVTAARQGDGYSYADCLQYIKGLFGVSDLSIVNLETTLSEQPPYSGYPMFKSPAEVAYDLKDAGVDVALLANNHICDMGGAGIKSTTDILDDAGVKYTGAFADSLRYLSDNPLTISKNGFKINILNYTYGTNGLPVPKGYAVNLIDTVRVAADLAKIEPSDDNLTFVCLHWGYEYNTTHSVEQELLARWLNSKGVDFVIGSHPHVIQPIEAGYDGAGNINRLTAYSLGNFVSNQQWENTDGGLVLRLDITKRTADGSVTVKPELVYVWTYRKAVEGRMKYYIVPSYMADSVLGDDPVALKKYDAFVNNARAITGSVPGVEELYSLPR